MMEAPSLKIPDTPGRSRFSKALPAPPPGWSPPPASPRASPTRRRLARRPLTPKAPSALARTRRRHASQAAELAAPSGPSSQGHQGCPSTLAPMAIPRRPIGNANGAASPTAAGGLLALPEPSPVGSISSLLSAYTYSSAGSFMKSSEATTSTKTSYMAPSPEQGATLRRLEEGGPAADPAHPPSTTTPSPRGNKPPVQEQDLPASAAAVKDDNVSPQTPVSVPAAKRHVDVSIAAPAVEAALSEVGAEPRRLRAQASGESRGQRRLLSSRRPRPRPTLPTARSTVPSLRSPFGLPGRISGHLPSLRELAAPTPAMGGTLSKIEAKVESKLGRNDSRARDVQQPESRVAAAPPIRRLPTPEYHHNDIRSPLVETVASPASPASSPELPSREPESKQPIARKPLACRARTSGRSRARPCSSPIVSRRCSLSHLSAGPGPRPG